MGKSTGFLEYEREVGRGKTPEDRIKNWNEFHASLSEEEQRRQVDGLRCALLPVRHDDWRDGQRMPPAQSGA